MHEATDSLVQVLGEEIESDQLRIAVAESCTGGLLCGVITANPEVSSALERGVVVYSPEAKCDLLGLDRQKVDACKGVSKEIAIDMAKSVLARSDATISVATTGFAGPREEDEEVGLVHVAVATLGGEIRHQVKHLGDQGRATICELTVQTALQILIDAVRLEKG